MGDPPSPQLISPPSSAQKSNFPMFYYGLIVVGTVTIILALYKIIVVRWCDDFDVHGSRLDSINDPGPTSEGGFHNSHVNFVTSFVYKKDDGCDDISCAICLCVFEVGEEIRQLPNCKHSFHATCIDLWLHSHMECPLCRSTVEPPDFQHRLVFEQPVNSRRFVVSSHLNLDSAFQHQLYSRCRTSSIYKAFEQQEHAAQTTGYVSMYADPFIG